MNNKQNKTGSRSRAINSNDWLFENAWSPSLIDWSLGKADTTHPRKTIPCSDKDRTEWKHSPPISIDSRDGNPTSSITTVFENALSSNLSDWSWGRSWMKPLVIHYHVIQTMEQNRSNCCHIRWTPATANHVVSWVRHCWTRFLQALDSEVAEDLRVQSILSFKPESDSARAKKKP